MRHILLTGFPGYLGSRLLEKLVRRDEPAKIYALVQKSFLGAARRRVKRLEAFAADGTEVEILEGDITKPELGIQQDAEISPPSIREIYHLAAIYDLGVSAPKGEQVNVKGTQHMLDWARKCSRLERFHYMSTCYVSGKQNRTFSHRELDEGQTFNNHYEASKFQAELVVQQAMRNGLPITIYRPSIVVGDSKTGFTQKYDGPYYILQWLMRQPKTALLPTVGNPSAHTVNLIPSDYVVEAIDQLSRMEVSEGNVYQLCDPDPLTVNELIDLFGKLTDTDIVRIPLPLQLAKAGLKYLPGLQNWTGIEPETVNYFVHPTRYDNEQTRRHLGHLECPPFQSYAHRLVSFMRAHPHPPDRYPIDIL